MYVDDEPIEEPTTPDAIDSADAAADDDEVEEDVEDSRGKDGTTEGNSR